MGMLSYFIIFHFLGVRQICVSSLELSKWRNNDDQKDIILNDHILQRFNDISKIQCAGYCDIHSSCASFFYHKSNKFCQLNSLDVSAFGSNQLNVISSQGTRFYIKNEVPTIPLLSSSPAPISTTESCKGFAYDDSVKKYYTYVSSFTGRVDEAGPKCHQIGGRLALLKTQASIDAVRSIIEVKASSLNERPDGIGFWLAASFVPSKMNFYWKDDDTVVSHTLWYPGQPELLKGSANNTNCVVLIPYYGYTLDDFECEKTDGTMIYPLCECP